MTRQQWFEALPASYAERAIANTRRYDERSLAAGCSDLRCAISSGFEWISTEEGQDFWHLVNAKTEGPAA